MINFEISFPPRMFQERALPESRSQGRPSCLYFQENTVRIQIILTKIGLLNKSPTKDFQQNSPFSLSSNNQLHNSCRQFPSPTGNCRNITGIRKLHFMCCIMIRLYFLNTHVALLKLTYLLPAILFTNSITWYDITRCSIMRQIKRLIKKHEKMYLHSRTSLPYSNEAVKRRETR